MGSIPMAAKSSSPRFEAMLTAEEVARVNAAMRAKGIKKRSVYTRTCLLGDSAGDAAALSSAIGALGLVLNEIHIASVNMPRDGTGPELTADLERKSRRLVSQGHRIYREAINHLARKVN